METGGVVTGGETLSGTRGPFLDRIHFPNLLYPLRSGFSSILSSAQPTFPMYVLTPMLQFSSLIFS